MITFEKVNILLVDDRPDKLLALETVLESLGQNIVKATSGAETLRAMLTQDFAVILLDVSMPIMDGFETASLIRQRPRSEHTPIIFITSINTNETHVSRGYALGAVDYIFAPIEPEILRSKVGVFIELYQKSEQIRIQAEMLRNKAEHRANLLESRLQNLLDSLNVGVFKLSANGHLMEANPVFLRLFGYGSLSELKAEVSQIFPELAKQALDDSKSDNCSLDLEFKRPDGSLVWISLTPTTVSDQTDGTVIEGLAEDITERKRTERAMLELNETLETKVKERSEALRLSQDSLRQSERLASLGTLAAGIAHEINNPLNSILMAAKYALRKPDDNPLLLKCLNVISSETTRCGKIIQSVLQFARNQNKARDVEDLNDVVRHAIDLIKTYVSTPITFDLQLQEKPLLTLISRTEIEQVLINILKNAVESGSEGSKVRIMTSNHGPSVRVVLSDSGPGIPASDLGKIFDPFYTTKTRDGGTGLGLSVAHGIVADHGGNIKAESVLGQGATFTVELPAYYINENQSKLEGNDPALKETHILNG